MNNVQHFRNGKLPENLLIKSSAEYHLNRLKKTVDVNRQLTSKLYNLRNILSRVAKECTI